MLNLGNNRRIASSIQIRMSISQQDLQPIRDKLLKLQSRKIAEGLVSLIANQMEQQISQGNILVSKNQVIDSPSQKSLPLSTKQKLETNSEQQKLLEITAKKDQIQKELEALRAQEQQLRLAKMNQSKVTSAHHHFRSELTAEDVQKIRKLKLEQKIFEKMLFQKGQRYEERIKKMKEEEEEQRQKDRRERYERKKQEIQKTMELIQRRKQERGERMQEQRKMLKKLKNRKKLHEQWEEKWKISEEEEERKKEEVCEELRKMQKVSSEEIKQHQRKYNEAMKTQKQSRMRQLLQSKLSSFCSYRSGFLERILEEDDKNKQHQQARKLMPRQFLNKIKDYSEKVKVLHKPNTKPKDSKTQIQEEEKRKLMESRSMSLLETQEKGNQYMRTANNKVAEALKKRNLNTTSIQAKPKTNEDCPRYKNYLKEIKKHGTSGTKQRSELLAIRDIMDKENLSGEEKLYRAKMVADKIESRKVMRNSEGVMKSIHAKMEILKKMDC